MILKVEIINHNRNQWRAIADAARTTVGKDAGDGEPSSAWKRAMLLAEHSPIRLLQVNWKWTDLPSWVSVHFVRHKIGIEHFVRTQRTDRTGIDRSELQQGALVTHQCSANAQAIIAISRKRLCNQASSETTAAWLSMLNGLCRFEPELANVCVPECVYRGFCPELKCCGFNGTPEYKFDRKMYTGGQDANS
jgi:hypothetical protein